MSVTLTQNAVPTTAPWQDRVRDKQQRILSDVPRQFIHPELKFSNAEAQDVLDLPTFSEGNPARVMDLPAKFLTADELAITALNAEDIPPVIAAGKWTAVQVLDAFTHRAVMAHQLLHCCLSFVYPQARAQAEALDAEFARTKTLVGPLHGVPLSVKDQCRIAGTETTCGYVSQLGVWDDADCLLVDILKKAGAVPFCKTTLSVGCMWGESINNIVGRASNPHNRLFTCGGSSGGEGALIGFRGSPLGVGSDLGGSIRTPSAYNGLHGLRPSSSRIPYYRVLNSMEGQEVIPSVVGPMAQSTKSLQLFVQAVVDAQPWLLDPKSPPIPWRKDVVTEIQSRPLRLAFLHYDKHVLPQPPIRKALRELEALLRAAGHDIVPMFVDALDQRRSDQFGSDVCTADADHDVQRSRDLSGEPKLPLLPARGPGALPPQPMTLTESWAFAMDRMEYQASVLKAWQETAATTKDCAPIDAYITCVNPSVAHIHGEFGRVRYKGYCATANVLDFSACTLPVTTMDVASNPPDRSETEDGFGEAIPAPQCDRDRWIRENYARNLNEYNNMPIVLQIVCKRWEEEKVLAISELVESLLKKEQI
ncbi:Acetamidase [Sporothrix bragantina]|uniref:amidase n=1 Tax=Sporothrix bragantina TaxID=671064 RepID=A0ABP0CVR3_9PEZI